MQVLGSNRPITTDGRTNFKISGIESQLRERERNNREEQLRVVVTAAPVAATATQCRFSARIDNATGETVSSTRTNTVKATLFEVVYRGFNRRVLLPSKFEVLFFLSFPFGSDFPFAAEHRAFHQVGWKDCETRAVSSQFRVLFCAS